MILNLSGVVAFVAIAMVLSLFFWKSKTELSAKALVRVSLLFAGVVAKRRSSTLISPVFPASLVNVSSRRSHPF
jgi:hypothetical protein